MIKKWISLHIILLIFQSCFQKSETKNKQVGTGKELKDKEPTETPSGDEVPEETPSSLEEESNFSLVFSPNDPLFELQWYLKNSGSTPFAMENGKLMLT